MGITRENQKGKVRDRVCANLRRIYCLREVRVGFDETVGEHRGTVDEEQDAWNGFGR